MALTEAENIRLRFRAILDDEWCSNFKDTEFCPEKCPLGNVCEGVDLDECNTSSYCGKCGNVLVDVDRCHVCGGKPTSPKMVD